jgi:hypothetical protein
VIEMRFDGDVVLVTGTASGIGRATATRSQGACLTAGGACCYGFELKSIHFYLGNPI